MPLPPPAPTPPSSAASPCRPLSIAVPTLCQIAATIGGRPAEFGGMLGASDDDVVRHYVFDTGARRDEAAYSPDTRTLSRLYREQWRPRGIRIVGFVHSHPPACRQPSWADAEYAARLLQWQPGLDRLSMPIVIAEPDSGRFEFLPFVAVRKGATARVLAVDLHCVGADQAPSAAPDMATFADGKPTIGAKGRRRHRLATSVAVAGAALAAWALWPSETPTGALDRTPAGLDRQAGIDNLP